MFKKILTGVAAGAMALGAVVGVATPANAYGPGSTIDVYNSNSQGGLTGCIGVRRAPNLPYVYNTICTDQKVQGPDNTGSEPAYIQVGGGWCVWEELFSRPNSSTGAHTTFEGNWQHGKRADGTGYPAGTWSKIVGYDKWGSVPNKDYWSTLRIYAC